MNGVNFDEWAEVRARISMLQILMN